MDFMLQAVPADERLRRYLRRLYTHSGIAYRHSVIRDLADTAAAPFFRRDADQRWIAPTTGQRNAVFVRESHPLFVGAARAALAQSGFAPGEVTQVVTVSCTGFYNPGPDYYIVRELGLATGTGRYHVGFMGCYALFPALRMAEAFCRAAPEAVVLVAGVELCTLHIQLKADPETLLAGALFADGGGALVVSARPPRGRGPALEIRRLATELLPDSEADMAWSIGDQGFDIALSSYVPKIIHAHLRGAVTAQVQRGGLALASVQRWAVHPGGRDILDKVASALGLDPEALTVSRTVLSDYGNLSSATLFFVLDAIRRAPAAVPGENICALAFGPGLTVELGLFRRPARAA